ncbi:bleomycin resistance protein [Mangrovicoccus ximenensis]|uniref:bleomycin resistance protein n=1 Tax=Mangrovicoccus ximenensis TaxID=1911570 RepID=UPI000D3C1159|nr:VOC family protein [Mangrovicoccus ximenensis]
MTDITTIPILRSPDLAATAQFYTGELGFSAETAGPDYLLLRRDAIELHFCPPDFADGRPTESCCYIRGAGIDALHDEWQAKSVPGFRPFTLRPWGMYEFYLSDPHGCLLKFGRSDREGAPPRQLTDTENPR